MEERFRSKKPTLHTLEVQEIYSKEFAAIEGVSKVSKLFLLLSAHRCNLVSRSVSTYFERVAKILGVSIKGKVKCDCSPEENR